LIDPVLVLKNISHRYEESGWSLHVPLLEIKKSEFVGIIGPNGAGKSTLLQIAAGVLRPDGGSVLLNGRSLSSTARRITARTLGFLPQELTSASDYSVEDIARMGRYPYLKGLGGLSGADERAVDRSLALTDLIDFRRRRLSQLSGGERKRAFLSSVLAQEPEIMLLDEPTGALDIHRQVQFFRLLRELADTRMGIVVVTHDLNLASLFSDRLVLLSGGRPFCSGLPAEVLRSSVLTEVYGKDIYVGTHPQVNKPIVLPDQSGGSA
jgi:iron complex transport system ATP-binding protein